MTNMTSSPGWYPDPTNPLLIRYWDGTEWSEQTQHRPPGMMQTTQSTTSGLAIASMVLGILWVFFIGSILAVIFGHVALSQIKKSGGSVRGRGMAIAGLVLGYIWLTIFVIEFLVAIARSSS